MANLSLVATSGANTQNPKNITSSTTLLEMVNESRLEFGEKEVRRNDFVARCRDELTGEYYETFVVKNLHGPASEELGLTDDQCLYISMRESKSVRRRVAQKLTSARLQAFDIPTTLGAALRLAADKQDQIEAQLIQLAVAAPKVAFVDSYVEATGLKGFRQVAKLLGVNEVVFRTFLKDNDIMYQLGGEWVAHQAHISAGRFSTKTGVSDVNGHAFTSCKFTPKGVAWVAGKIAEDKAKKALEEQRSAA